MEDIIKIIVKIFGFIFGWRAQVEVVRASYARNLASRIVAIVLLLGLTALSIVCEFWMMAEFKSNVVIGIIALILLCAIGLTTFKLLTLYASACFRSAKEAKKEANLALQEQQSQQLEPAVEHTYNDIVVEDQPQQPIEQQPTPYKTYRAFDLTMGIVFTVLALGLATTLILIPILKLKAVANA